MIKKILVLLLVVIAGILAYAATRPDTYQVERSIVINTTPDKPYALVNNFHRWEEWSPWEKLDPAMKRNITGPDDGVGQVYTWEGNRKVGSGRMEILGDAPSSFVNIKLNFYKPMEDEAPLSFTFTPEGSTTTVRWTMSGKMTYLSKVMCIFVSMDRMVGGDFERGLQQLKVAAEKQ